MAAVFSASNLFFVILKVFMQLKNFKKNVMLEQKIKLAYN